MKRIIFLIFVLTMFLMCKDRNKMYLNGTSRTTNGCDCTPPIEGITSPCKNSTVKCVKHFFNNGGFTRYYTVQWQTGCAAFLSSTLKICYNANCKFQLQFFNLPFCVKDCCLEENKCYETDNFSCGNHTINIQFETTNCQGFAVGIIISGDPNITLHCIDYNGNSFTLTGILI